ncbi:MAG: hypothetical protein JXM73_22185, partial [Anaerolineae bacterium]|nr:hypothetical protein [Anaerolineae bacterium]
ILSDFDVLLSSLRGREVPVSQTYQLITGNVLAEINARLMNPIEVRLERPVLKSYPNLHGLYLLLRATGLGRIVGKSYKPVLTIDEALRDSWSSLNLTERYFTLLETWLLRGRPEIIGRRGARRRFSNDYLQYCTQVLHFAQGDGLPIAGNSKANWYVSEYPGLHGLALMEMFGFLWIEHGQSRADEGWQIERVYSMPLGEAILALLHEETDGDLEQFLDLYGLSSTSNGLLQPLFQPYVPAWRNNLPRVSMWTFQPGVYVFRVSLGRHLWRRIAASANVHLTTLGYAILSAFEVDSDPTFEFEYRDRYGVEMRLPDSDLPPEAILARNQYVGDIPFEEGRMTFQVRQGWDEQTFNLVLERIEPQEEGSSTLAVLAGSGDALARKAIGNEGENG